MTKYKEYFNRMVEENKDIFEKFKALHANYGMDEERFQEEFNHEGEKILAIAHDWENKLCSQSEKAGFSGYTGNLAEKFQTELRNTFPLIDHVGIIIKKSPPPMKFTLKKISLH